MSRVLSEEDEKDLLEYTEGGKFRNLRRAITVLIELRRSQLEAAEKLFKERFGGSDE